MWLDEVHSSVRIIAQKLFHLSHFPTDPTNESFKIVVLFKYVLKELIVISDRFAGDSLSGTLNRIRFQSGYLRALPKLDVKGNMSFNRWNLTNEYEI